MNQLFRYDFLIVGSGFAGSIAALALAKSGFDVCLIEKKRHPRFAIGESSTPVADMILRDLADRYDLPFLKQISRYKEWQKHHPEVTCGLKRGFSYYFHQKEKPFRSDRNHTNELLVAASKNDENSDTNWLRSDVDHFLVKQVKKTEAGYFDQTAIKQISRENNIQSWKVVAERKKETLKLQAKWIIDATGSPAFSEAFFETTSTSNSFETDSLALYSHFENTGHWHSYLKQHDFHLEDYPFNPDHSALHHLIDEGWIWMLRFNNDLLSSGLMIDAGQNKSDLSRSPEVTWEKIISTYPSVKKLFENKKAAKSPGQFYQTRRLQRSLNKTFGDGWVALNHTAGFVDPLHSTGIAHTLAGLEKLLNIFTNAADDEHIHQKLRKTEKYFYRELALIDLMVSSCYLSRSHFELFTAASMLYFIASVRYERARLKGNIPDTFLCAGESDLAEIVVQSHQEIRRLNNRDIEEYEIQHVIQNIRDRIAPFNTAGLMDPSKKNMYSHTAVKL